MRLRVAGLLVMLVSVVPVAAEAATVFEVYTDRASFEARVGGSAAVRVVDFDDVDTATSDPVTFPSARYRGSHGVRIVGEDAQRASRSFGDPAALPPVSAPNVYRSGDNETTVYFFAGLEMTTVSAVGVTFVGYDYPTGGPSRLQVSNFDGSLQYDTGPVVGAGPHLFRGVVAIDDAIDQPTPAISGAHVTAGPGYPDPTGPQALDDLVFTIPQPRILGEICDNCVDDDGDYYVDRDDGECSWPADGGARGLGDPALAKLMAKCQKASAKSGAAFVAAMQKQLHACAGAVLQCLEVKAADAACLPKAVAKCGKASAKIDALAEKLSSAMGAKCAPLPDLGAFSLQGLGYSAEYVDCLRYGVTLLQGSDIGECIVRQHRCGAQQLVSAENTRAIELAKLGQLDLASGFACLEAGANGNQSGLGDPARGKAVVKCQQAIAKAGITYAAKRQKQIGKCYDLVTACVQTAPDFGACVSKATDKCSDLLEPVWGGLFDPKSLAGKAQAAIVKACGALLPADLLAPEGVGRGDLAAVCAALGVPTLGSAADVAACLVAQHDCRVDDLLLKQYPRARELDEIYD